MSQFDRCVVHIRQEQRYTLKGWGLVVGMLLPRGAPRCVCWFVRERESVCVCARERGCVCERERERTLKDWRLAVGMLLPRSAACFSVDAAPKIS